MPLCANGYEEEKYNILPECMVVTKQICTSRYLTVWLSCGYGECSIRQ